MPFCFHKHLISCEGVLQALVAAIMVQEAVKIAAKIRRVPLLLQNADTHSPIGVRA